MFLGGSEDELCVLQGDTQVVRGGILFPYVSGGEEGGTALLYRSIQKRFKTHAV